MITPLEIENKKFSKQMMNGYSVEEVDEFLDELTVDYEKAYKESTELKNKVEELENYRRYTSKHISYGSINSRRSKRSSQTTSRSNNKRS